MATKTISYSYVRNFNAVYLKYTLSKSLIIYMCQKQETKFQKKIITSNNVVYIYGEVNNQDSSESFYIQTNIQVPVYCYLRNKQFVFDFQSAWYNPSYTIQYVYHDNVMNPQKFERALLVLCCATSNVYQYVRSIIQIIRARHIEVLKGYLHTA